MNQETRIVEGCQKGDRKLQKELYEKYASGMMVVCLRYSKSTLEAEDILQESFIKVFKNIQKFQKDSNLGAWIKKIVVNTALNAQRKKLYMYPMVDIEQTDNHVDEKVVLAEFHLKELIDMIRTLPMGCQAIFNMYAVEGFSHKEIAEKLNISEGTSKSQYARAKMLLRKKLDEARDNRYEQYR